MNKVSASEDTGGETSESETSVENEPSEKRDLTRGNQLEKCDEIAGVGENATAERADINCESARSNIEHLGDEISAIDKVYDIVRDINKKENAKRAKY